MMAERIAATLTPAFEELGRLDGDALADNRYEKFRKIGAYEEVSV